MPKSRVKETFAKVLCYESGADLPLARKYLEAVLTMKKKSTVREGVLLFSPKCQLFLHSSPDTPRVPVTVIRYVSKLLKHVTLRDARDDGFSTREALILELRQYYPALKDDSVVTIVRFRPSSSGMYR